MFTPKENRVQWFDDLYRQAKTHQRYSEDQFKAYRDQYESSKLTKEDGGQFSAIRPLSYELIESQVSTTIPPIMCSPERYNQGRARNAQTLEKTILQDMQKAKISKLNDEDERNTYIYGTSIFLVEWDESIKHHGEAGAPVISLVRPDKFIAQPGIAEVQRQEYCFIDFDTTIYETARKYDVDVDDIKANIEMQESEEEHPTDEDSIVVHCCYYKNADGKVSEYCWTGRYELLDYEDIYARRREVCEICGRSGNLSEDGRYCDCGGDIIRMPVDFEELTHDIKLDAGMVVKTKRVIPALSPSIVRGRLVMENKPKQVIQNGKVLSETINGVEMPLTVMQPTAKMEPTRIPWYQPGLFPVVARKNTSTEASIFGQSDMQMIKHIQDEYNKVKSRIYQKINGSSVFPVYPERAKFVADNSINAKVLKLPEGISKDMFGVIDTQVSIQQDLIYLQTLYDEAKRTLGITDSYVGQADNTAKSGVAKQVQVSQAAGRLESKRQMKYQAYTEIADIIFQYRLAYSDEPVAVKTTDEFGMIHDSAFNRYDYVEYDMKTGEWYYDDRYIFSVNAAANADSNPTAIWQAIKEEFAAGMYGNQQDPATLLRVWLMLEKSHYPNASEQVNYYQQLIVQQQMMMTQPQALPGGNNALPGGTATQQKGVM